jgi:LmbE family N-acetylglucosaminyl deacetylase
MTEALENWQGTKKIMIILAHPDDPEFFLGGTIARWLKMGHEITYLILTKGDKGAPVAIDPLVLAGQRVEEQLAAARSLGVKEVDFLEYKDGFLTPDTKIRREVVREIRKRKPDIVVSSDPTNYFPSDMYINHPDHRKAGEIVIEAVFPAANNPLFFPELISEGLEPHQVQEVWFSLTSQPNIILDVTEYFPDKLKALKHHRSQIREPEAFEKRMLSRRVAGTTEEEPHFEEKFKRILYK